MTTCRNRQSNLRLLLSLAVFFFGSPNAWCQLSSSDIEDLTQKATGQGALVFTRISSSGLFGGCELQFNVAVRDWRTRQGALVKLAGSISSYYQRGKAFNVNLKLLGEDLTIHPNGTLGSQPFRPFDGALRLGEMVLPSKRAITKFSCEPHGVCLGFSDPGIEFVSTFVEALVENSIEVLFTRNSGGVDLIVNPVEIQPHTETIEQYQRFTKCYPGVSNKLRPSITLTYGNADTTPQSIAKQNESQRIRGGA